MALYEFAVFDHSDPVLDPMWSVTCCVCPQLSRLRIERFRMFRLVCTEHFDISGLDGTDAFSQSKILVSFHLHFLSFSLVLRVESNHSLRKDFRSKPKGPAKEDLQSHASSLPEPLIQGLIH